MGLDGNDEENDGSSSLKARQSKSPSFWLGAESRRPFKSQPDLHQSRADGDAHENALSIYPANVSIGGLSYRRFVFCH